MEKNRKKRLWFVYALSALFLAGCAAMGLSPQPPGISVAALRLKEIRGFETIFEVDLRVLNRGETPLFITGLDCDLELNGHHLAQGVAAPQKQIAPYSGDTLTVTVYASVVNIMITGGHLLKGAGAARPGANWNYTVKGRLRLGNQGRFLKKLPFESKGEIDPGLLLAPRK